MVVCEIPNIAMNSRSARVWANQSNIPQSNATRSLSTKWTLTKLQERFRRKWMARRSSIQIIPAHYWALFLTQSTTNLDISVMIGRSGCWMPIIFANRPMTVLQARTIPFQAYPELSVWHTRFGPSGSLWGDGFGMLICQEHWRQMRWVLDRLSPRLQWQCFANWCLRKL